MSSALAGLKTTYERTKSKILSKGDDADDKEYLEEKEKAIFYEQIMLRLNKRTKKSLELYAELSKLQNDITDDINSMYPSDDRLYTTVSLVKEAARSAESNRQKMVERIERNSIHPVDEYCASFREIKKRMEDYNIKRTDMERHRAEVHKLQEKGAAGSQKLPLAEEKYKVSLQKYEEMREEMLTDLPALNNDRSTMLGFVLSCSLKSQAAYYTDLAEKYSVANSLVASIDEKAVLSHGKVVTPNDRSAAATNLRAHPIFNKGEAQKTQQMQPMKSPTQSQPQPTYTQPPAQSPPVVQTSFSLQKQNPPDHSVYNAEYGSITAQPPSAPVAQTSEPPFKPVKAQGLYDFTATEDNELSFKKGDIITIIAKQHGDWWEGELNGVAGLLPSNYVKEL
eukprot:Phypoly_transcript_08141.p1 GENE.Phypoly_transcript_08141~~Phypoly_transcript_08141.p1  ORF type:complete len:395 (-),score=82.91 Phypoly_transcript_08141:280-1464(-)